MVLEHFYFSLNHLIIFQPRKDDIVKHVMSTVSCIPQFHQLSTHYLSCHAAMEAYSMATMRNLPDPHPIYKLLQPHFRYTMAINARARASLINKGGIIDRLFAIGGEGKVEVLKRSFANYSVYCTNIKCNIKKMGGR